MVDTVRLFLSQDSVENVDLLSELPTRFEDYSVHESRDNIWFSGNVQNLKWSVFRSGLSISGSLPKFHFGENYTVLKSHHLKKVFKQLSTVFNVDLGPARITQIDFGVNLICHNTVTDYFKYLGRSPYYKSRNINNTTLTYSNSFRYKHLYDKVREMKASNEDIPKIIQGKNILRFEIKYRKKCSKYFDIDNLTVADICSYSFLQQLKAQIETEFNSIKRVKVPSFRKEIIATPSDFKNQLAAIFINDIGSGMVNQ